MLLFIGASGMPSLRHYFDGRATSGQDADIMIIGGNATTERQADRLYWRGDRLVAPMRHFAEH